jgi:poly(A) polymerase
LPGRRERAAKDNSRAAGRSSAARQAGRHAVVILASDDVAAVADEVRRRHDPEWFERVPPHVSLLGPFEPEEPDGVLTARLAEAVRGAASFEVRLSAPDCFIVPELVLFLEIEDEAPVARLHHRLAEALPEYRPALPFHPHLTVGRFASEKELARALTELRAELARLTAAGGTLGFRAEEIHLFGEDPETGVYRSLARVPLGGA